MLVPVRHVAVPRMPAGADTQCGPDRVAVGAVVDQADSAIQEYQLYDTLKLYFQLR